MPTRLPHVPSIVATPADRVLALLREQGGTLSGEVAAAHLKISRAAVWKQIRALRALGYTIESHGRLGYRLTAAPNAAVPSEVTPRLRTRLLGRTYHYLARTDSTNAVLAKLAAQGAPAGTVVVAEQQGAGRGRMARGWHSPPDVGLYCSILLRPQVEVAQITSLPLVVGLAIADVVASYLPAAQTKVKWPNDIWGDGKKICGILCELQAETDGIHHVIVGIGINVNTATKDFPHDLQETATSLKRVGDSIVSRPDLLAALLARLESDVELWQRDGLTPFLPRLRARDALYGRTVTIDRAAGEPLTGVADGVNADGSLRLRLPDGRETAVYSGDAHMRPF